MSRMILKAEYERLAGYPSVQNWLNSLSESQATRNGALYSLLRFTRHTGRNPEELLTDKEAELQKERRLRFGTEDARGEGKGILRMIGRDFPRRSEGTWVGGGRRTCSFAQRKQAHDRTGTFRG